MDIWQWLMGQQQPAAPDSGGMGMFPPDMPLDTSQIRDWRGARNPWAGWLNTGYGAAFDPAGPRQGNQGYPYGPWGNWLTVPYGDPPDAWKY